MNTTKKTAAHKITWQTQVEQMIYMFISIYILQLIAQNITEASNIITLVYILLLSIPVWFFLKEAQIYSRRIFLKSLGTEDGQAIRWFWKATGLKIFLLFKSIIIVSFIIAMSSLFSEHYWLVLYVDVLFITLIQYINQHWINQEINPLAQSLVNRRVLYSLNILLISLAIIYIDFALVGSNDTRNLQWHDVFSNAFAPYSMTNNNNAFSLMIGLVAGLDALSWHFMQTLVPQINNTGIKILAWFAFLIPIAVNITFILLYLLGVHHLCEIKQKKGWIILGQSIASRAFMITLFILALGTIYLSSIEIPSYEDMNKKNQMMSVLIDPCAHHASDVALLQTKLNDDMELKRQQLNSEITHRIDTKIDHVFEPVEKSVDEFLDWYYTIMGEYQRLGAAITGDVAHTIQGKLKFYLFDKTRFNKNLDSINQDISTQNKNQLILIGQKISTKANTYFAQNTCTLPKMTLSGIQSFRNDGQKISAAMMTGITTGTVIAKGAGKMASKAIITKIAGKKIFKSSISLVVKALAKKGGSSLLGAIGTGALSGSICGPICSAAGGVIGGLTVWFIVDKSMIEIDEHLNRDEFKQEILTSIAEHKQLLSIQMKKNHFNQVNSAIYELNTALNNDFIPYDDSF